MSASEDNPRVRGERRQGPMEKKITPKAPEKATGSSKVAAVRVSKKKAAKKQMSLKQAGH